MAEFPYAEAYPERAAATAQELNMRRDAFRLGLSGMGGGGFLRGFAGLRGAPVPARAAGPRPSPELAAELERLGGTPGPSPFRTLLERSRAGEIDRPWVGTKSMYQTEGQRVLPPSYVSPREFVLPENMPDMDQIVSVLKRILPVLGR